MRIDRPVRAGCSGEAHRCTDVLQRTTYKLQRTTYKPQRATRNMQHTSCSRPHENVLFSGKTHIAARLEKYLRWMGLEVTGAITAFVRCMRTSILTEDSAVSSHLRNSAIDSSRLQHHIV